MTKKKKIIVLAAVVISVAVLIIAAGFLAPRMFDPETHRAELIQIVKTALKRDIQFAKGDFSFWLRPSFIFTGVVIREKDAQSDFITADRLHFKLSLLPLLQKKVVLDEATLVNPNISIIREASGAFNVSDLLDDTQQRLRIGINRVNIQDGVVHFTDRRVAAAPQTASLERLNLRLKSIERGTTADFSLSAGVVTAGKNSAIAIDGSIEIAGISESLLKSRIDAAVKISGLEMGWFWPYYSRHVPFRQPTGSLDIDARCRGTIGEFESHGSLTLHDLHFDYPPVFHTPLQPKTVRAVYAMKLDAHDISMTQLDVTVDGVNVRGSCLLKDIHTDDPLIDAKAVTGEIRWEKYSHFVPYGIIPKDTADFIEQKIRGGIFRLDEGSLNGRVSRIAHMEKGDNYNVLHVRGRVQQGVLAYAPDVPVFTDISGALELKVKDFILHNMSGKFGDAPFSLEGKLTDYCLDTPTHYPFTLKLTPTFKEAAWLLGDDFAKKLHYAGTSTLTLTGDGSVENYKLSGALDLSAAEYKYSDLLAKKAGKANDLIFAINLTNKEAHFSSVRFNLLPLSLGASARYAYATKRWMSLAVDTNAFQLREMAPLVPKIEKFTPRGQVRLAVKARRGPEDFADLGWHGEVALAGVSFKPAESVRALSNMTGKIRLRGHTLETTPMTLKLGGATISARGRIENIKNPTLSVSFSSVRMDAADLGLRHAQQPVVFHDINGTLAFKDRDMQIDALTFHLNDSIFNIKGAVQSFMEQPGANINVTSPFLDWRDIVILSDLRRAEKNRESGTDRIAAAIKADIQADAGRMDRFAFEKLRTNVSFDHKILYLQALAVTALGGKLAGSGRIDLADDGAPRYHFNFRLDKLSAQQCLDFLGAKGKNITGTVSATGDLTAKGGNSDVLKKTALGHVRIQIEEGMLMRSALLSRTFSMINESQLSKVELPDLARDGMSYRKILAMLSLQDGIISTNNLLVQTDAMNISAVAKIDMPKGEFIDTVVAVQLLHTVGKAISRIPVVGWILTDEKHSVMSVHFEVSGSLDNPTVKAVPVKSLARGVFDIFKNIFQLPAKLFTDTGEVLLGR